MRAGGNHRSGLPAALALALLSVPLAALAHGDAAGDIHALASIGWSGWNSEPWLWSLMLGSAGLYACGLARLWREAGPGRGIQPVRAAAFALGWLALAAALLSPLDTWSARLFSVHMVQHELLMLVAAPLLAVARPLGAFVWALPRRWRRPAWRCVHEGGIQRSVRALSQPLTAWAVHAAALWVWHVPALFQRALASEPVHIAQHLSFFVTALLFWWALLRPGMQRDGYGLSTLYVLTTAMHTGALGALLTFAQTPWYPAYAASAQELGMTALEDQQLGGLIMWVPAGFVYLGIALMLFGAWLQAPRAAAGWLAPAGPARPARR